MVFVRYFSGIIVWIAIIGYFIALIVLAAFCYTQSQDYYAKSKISASPKDQTNASDTAQTLEILSYCIFAIWVLSVIGLFCIMEKIKLAIAVIKTAALFVRDEFEIILIPPIIAFWVGVLWVWWIISAMYQY
jgi:beta-lactamase regulating signal transducer with metallopeptidase domain